MARKKKNPLGDFEDALSSLGFGGQEGGDSVTDIDNQDVVNQVLDDPNAHFDDKWKTPYHPTFSDQSVYSNAKHPGGTWGRFDYRDAYYAPLFSYVNPNDRIAYLNMAEENGVVPFMNNCSMYRIDGDLYGGVLPAVQVIGKRGKK